VIAEAELKELQRELKKKGDSPGKQAEESTVQTLHKMLTELKKLEKALKENLAEMEKLSRENLDKYRKNQDQLEMRLDQFKERLNKLVEKTEKRRESLNEQVREKVIDILEEMKKTLNRIEEGVKRQRQAENMLRTKTNRKSHYHRPGLPNWEGLSKSSLAPERIFVRPQCPF
jgi:DNA repair exonuclease SbcCD ATPase subunit